MFNKLTNLREYLPELIFLGFSLRMIVTGASIGDAIAIISLVAIYGFTHFIKSKKIDQEAELRKDIDDLRNAITSIKLSNGLVTKRVTGNEQKQAAPKRFF